MRQLILGIMLGVLLTSGVVFAYSTYNEWKADQIFTSIVFADDKEYKR